LKANEKKKTNRGKHASSKRAKHFRALKKKKENIGE